MLAVLLVRHAEPVHPDSGLAEHERPLTARGRADADALATSLDALAIDAVYSSPYLRAVHTVEPLARRRGLAVAVVDDLRERLLSPAPLADWRRHLERAWLDFDYAPAGGETGRAAQTRALAVLDALRPRHANGTIVLASHGNLIALLLQAFAPHAIDYAFWSQMPMPAVYRLEHDERWTWRPS